MVPVCRGLAATLLGAVKPWARVWTANAICVIALFLGNASTADVRMADLWAFAAEDSISLLIILC